MVSNHKHSSRRGFTLIELLVVIAIIAILASILFPVFAQAKAAAKKTVDIARFKQVGTATQMYIGDSDGRFMMSNSGGNASGWGFGPPDTVPGMQMMPYCKNTEIFTSVNDPTKEADRIRQHAADNGWNVNKLTESQRLYALMTRSNMGYNYAFFSPWRLVKGNPTSATVSESQVGSPSDTLMFGTSIWDRDPKSGTIRGGGNWVIETPCWLDGNGNLLEPLAQYDADGTLWSYSEGWYPPKNPPGGNGWLVYGGLWPFHNQTSLSNISAGLVDGHVIITMADTSTKSKTVKSLLAGCEAYGAANRKGKVTDSSKFIWDLN